MTDILHLSYINELFPEYSTRLCPITPHEGACVAGQVQNGYYTLPQAPAADQARQHLLLTHDGKQLGVFEEPCLKPEQATMKLNLISAPSSPIERKRFSLLMLTYLLANLKHPPSAQHPIIVRGADAGLSRLLTQLTSALGFAPRSISDRSVKPGFFSLSNTTPLNDPLLGTLIETLKTHLHTSTSTQTLRPK